MCGITVVISQDNRPIDSSIIQPMTDSIHHRGPDGEGFYYGDNFAFGHRRLAIIDLDERSNQPMTGVDDLVITYNGEIYNYIEIKDELIKQGYEFKTESDTEVVLSAYHYWGAECLDKFNGMWAFAIYDPIDNSIFISRDRFGIKPIYFTQSNEKFAIISEIKQLTKLKGWSANLNHQIAFDFLTRGYLDHNNETFFENVYKLMPGHFMKYNLSTHEYNIEQWYHLNKVKKNLLNNAQLFFDYFKRAVNLRLRSDVKVGSCLSGGMDSSAIVCTVNQLLKEHQKTNIQETVSSCFNNKAFDEQHYIDKVVAKTGVKSNKVFPKIDDLNDVFNQMIWHQDEPVGSSSIFAQWTVFKESKKKNLKVMLDGQGADEQLCGYFSFFSKYLSNLFVSLKWPTFFRELNAISSQHSISKYKLLVYSFAHLMPVKLSNYLLQRQFKKSLTWLNKRSFKFPDFYFKRNDNSLHTFCLEQLLVKSLPALLHYEDRNSMAHSVESRVPFLDVDLVEFIIGLPDYEKINNGITKKALRKGMANIVPKAVIDRNDKMAFVTPEALWIKSIIENTDIDYEKLPSWINNTELQSWLKLKMNQTQLDQSVWRFICFYRWIEVFDVSIQ